MIFMALVRFYWAHLTRFTPHCPNTPSCSAYGYRAARLHGSLRGTAMAWRRIRSCGEIAEALGAAPVRDKTDCTSGPWYGRITSDYDCM